MDCAIKHMAAHEVVPKVEDTTELGSCGQQASGLGPLRVIQQTRVPAALLPDGAQGQLQASRIVAREMQPPESQEPIDTGGARSASWTSPLASASTRDFRLRRFGV